jgi:DNA polymerase-3 subunit alpha
MSTPWISLHTHSQYSILDALPSVEALAARAKEHSMKAIALTDHGNLFGAVEFYKACKEAGVKPIIGCELYLAPGDRSGKERARHGGYAYHITLLVKDSEGYYNLCKLSSIGYLEGLYYTPRIDKETLKKHAKGLICLSGCLSSPISQAILANAEEEAEREIQWFYELFGEDFYFELQRHPMEEQDLDRFGYHNEAWRHQQYRDMRQKEERVNRYLIEASKRWGIPLVATNDIHYLEQQDALAHEILLNVQSGEPCEIWEMDAQGNPKQRILNPKRRTYPSAEYYFKTVAQMNQLFADLPEALSNTLEVAAKCDFHFDFKSKYYPVYCPDHLAGTSYSEEERRIAAEEFLWKLCREGISRRYTAERLAKVADVIMDKDPMEVVQQRLEYEMSVIVPKGMCDYLLIVYDFINWAKANGIPMGPGRGSGAGSIVLYLIGITDIEPLRFHLFFERFINPERISYPDIDVDICMDKRNEVISYTIGKYGQENVAQIITFGTMKAKSSIKDVGRVLSVPLAKVNQIAKLIPEDLAITIDKALDVDPDLQEMYSNDPDTHRVIDLAKKLEGSVRNIGIHAAGIIICGDGIANHIPVCKSKDSEMALTQYSMKPAEMVGMLKVDFLGLKTLTSIKKCVDAIERSDGRHIDWVNLPLDDQPTFNLLNQGKTLGVFQLESGGMQELARNLHLDRFEEIIAVAALYRPGPMDMIPLFIDRKHGRQPIEYDHPWMEPILAETYGVMVYQEQVMQIAQRLASFSLGEGDLLRRAMGKKDAAQMANMRTKFLEGAKGNAIDGNTAGQIFDKMERFAAYGFNKSHAAAYGYLSYVTAYLKANYCGQWMAALMTCDSHDTSKVGKFLRECQALGIAVLPPDVNESDKEFVAVADRIRFSLLAVKGVGEGVVDAIIEERNRQGPFANLYDFFQRVDAKKINKKAVEKLIRAGAFDFTRWSRDQLAASIDSMHEAAVIGQKENAAGILDLFGGFGGESAIKRFNSPPEVVAPQSEHARLLTERELLGFFLTGHPMDQYQSILQRLSCAPLHQFHELGNNAIVRAAFILENVQVRYSSKNMKKFALTTISDGSGESFELPIWSNLYEESSALIQDNQLVYAVLQLEQRDEEEGIKLSCRWIADLTTVNDQMIQACDEAYDRAKKQVEQRQAYPPSGTGQKKAIAKEEKDPAIGKGEQKKVEKQVQEQKNEKAKELLQLKIDADRIKYSQILALGELFAAHAGNTAIEMHFFKSSQEGIFEEMVGMVEIEAAWGVTLEQPLLDELKSRGIAHELK